MWAQGQAARLLACKAQPFEPWFERGWCQSPAPSRSQIPFLMSWHESLPCDVGRRDPEPTAAHLSALFSSCLPSQLEQDRASCFGVVDPPLCGNHADSWAIPNSPHVFNKH